MSKLAFRSITISLSIFLSSCGLYVPEKDILHADTRNAVGLSREGLLESNIVANIRCEVQNAIYEANKLGSVPWLATWGTQVTLKLTWDEMSAVAPTVSIIDPLKAMQSFAFGFGATGSSHATRLETVTFIWENEQLLRSAETNLAAGQPQTCKGLEDGPMIQSDLKIGDFIYDKATLAYTRVASTEAITNFNTFQEDITFVASYGGNITPVWKLTKVAANSSGTFLGASRGSTGDVLITLGPLAPHKPGVPPRLGEPAASQHTAGIIGSSVGTQNATQLRQ